MHGPAARLMTASRPPYRRSLLQQERSHNTRRAILRAAVGLFGDQDFDATTVEDVCRSAGIGRSTFYLYFESKDRLLIALAEATAEAVAADVGADADAGADALTVDHAIAVFIEGVVRRMEAVSPRLAALVMRRVSAATVTPRPLPGDPILFDHILAGIIRQAQARGEVRADLDPGEVGEVLAGMTLDALERWAAEPEAKALRPRLEFRLTTFLAALRT